MKKGTQYAKKLKVAYARFRGCAGESIDEQFADPIEQLIVAVLSRETTMARARAAQARLAEAMVDYNELRVSTPAEVAEALGSDVPNSVHCAKNLLELLNAVYQREYRVSLDGLSAMGVREMKSYLEGLEGMTPYVSASLLLWSLGGHAIPVNNVSFEYLRQADLVDAGASVAEVQAFLERHVSAADAKSFCLDLELHAAQAAAKSDGAARTKRSVKKATSKKAASAKAASKKPVAKKAVTKKAAAKKRPSSTKSASTASTAKNKSKKKTARR